MNGEVCVCPLTPELRKNVRILYLQPYFSGKLRNIETHSHFSYCHQNSTRLGDFLGRLVNSRATSTVSTNNCATMRYLHTALMLVVVCHNSQDNHCSTESCHFIRHSCFKCQARGGASSRRPWGIPSWLVSHTVCLWRWRRGFQFWLCAMVVMWPWAIHLTSLGYDIVDLVIWRW